MASPRSARWAAAGVIGSVAALAAGLAPVASADASDTGVQRRPARTAGVVLALDGEKLSLDLADGAGGSAPSRDEPDVDIVVSGADRATVPEGDAYGFLGGPGADVWVLDGSGPDGRSTGETPGWDTTGIPADRLADGTVEWALTGVEGPGDVAVFEPARNATPEIGATGPRVLFDSGDGLTDVRTLPAAERGEVAWAFTEPGDYRLSSQATARLATGATATASAEWTVRVAADAPRPPAAPGPSPTPVPTPSTADGSAAGTRPVAARVAPAPALKAADGDVAVSQKVVIGDGHVDAIAGKMVGGALRTLFKDSRNPADVIWREPSSVVLHVGPNAREKVPANSSYAFLGKAGSDFWLIPQVQKQGVVWAGWNTEALGAGDLKGPLDMRLTKVAGPGPLVIWETAGLGGARVLYNSGDGLPDTQKVNLGVHAHANWGFAKEGVYRVTFQLSGTLPNGRTTSDTRTYTFAVGDIDPNAVTPGDGSGDGGSTGGPGSDGPSTGGGSGSGPDGGPASGAEPGAASGPGGAATAGTGGSDTAGGGGAGGSLAHTGGGAAIPLALSAGALVLGGAAVVRIGHGRRRTAPAGEAGPS